MSTKRKLKSVTINYTRFSSLDNLIEIINNSSHFQIQILTLEAFETFSEYLKYKSIPYKPIYPSLTNMYDKKILNIIFEHPNTNLVNYKIILFNKSIHLDFIPYIFTISQSEKLNYLKHKYPQNLISEIKKPLFLEKNIFQLSNHIKFINFPICALILTYLEKVILFALNITNRYEYLFKTVKEIDNNLGNSFLIKVTLNSLVNKNVIIKRGNIYSIIVDRKTIEITLKTVGFDINRL
ncbi:hypothetical protein CWI39_0349p0020 [Hamiltosporidium magnivora]|uniref:Uncharacterized protein n=1 Tax=Hamiltosporidium magnivora TaxID=148818 RepID=A0A4Q9LGJ8_9MICR|nr:hypothetical protein CWI39_0349p0020 [Hamiltosporidium magnivora]